MSKTVDQRIVDMRFNNKQFGNGIKDTLKSLDNLKKGLNLKDAGKGLSDLQNAGSRFNMSGMTAAVSKISSKFSAMGVIGFSVLQNLTNQAIRLGKKMANGFLKPMTTGFEEYELKMNSIQTIMTNVRDKGTTLEEVNVVLDDLNGYADKTIYNFAQMTANLGKFTTAGLGAAEAATTIKGIGNIAAGFGVDATKMAGATYQISQALQSPYFMIRDWMSLESAGLSGSLMKDSLKETAIEMGIFVDESVPFRASLEQGWLTAEVFSKTMAKFAEDKNLLAAAQNVTTFTKLLGVMAEVKQSGWASVWEQIVGNKEQSTKLWTGIANAFGDVVGAVDAARVSMFKFWNEKGGRRDFLIGIANVLFILADILAPIEQAFADVFKSMSGEELVALSKRFRELTENFKIGEDTSEKLGRAFGGLFSMISIGKKILITLAKSVFVVVKAFTSLSSGSGSFLEMAASIGDFWSNIDKTVFTTANLSKALSTLGAVITPVAKVIKQAFMFLGGALAYLTGQIDTVAIGEYFVNLKTELMPVFAQLKNDLLWLANKVDLDAIKNELTYIKNKFLEVIGAGEGIGSVFENLGPNIVAAFGKVREFLKPVVAGGSIILGVFTKIGGVIKTIFGAISGFVLGVINEIKGIGGAIGGGAGGIAETMGKIWNAVDFEMLEKLLKGSLLASIVLVLRKFVVGLSNITSGAGDFMEGIVDILEEVQDTLEAYQKSIKATILLKIAAAIGILTLSLIALSLINPARLAAGLGAMGLLLAEVMTAMHLFNKNMDSDNVIDLAKLSTGLIGLGLALVVLSGALIMIGMVDLETAAQGLAGIAGLVGILIGVSHGMKTNVTGLAKLSLQFVLLAIALTAMVVPLAIMGSLPLETLYKGLVSMGLVLAGLVGFTHLMSKVSGAMGSAQTLVVISVALIAVAYALKITGTMKWEEIERGLWALGGALLIIAGAMKIIKPTDVASAASLLIIVSAMLLVGFVLRDLGVLEWEIVAKGLMFMIASLGILAGAMKIIKPTDVASATALLIITGAMLLMGTVLRDLGDMDWEVMAKGLTAMAGALLILVVAANSMTTAVVGAGAMVVIAAALMLLVPSIAALAVLPIEGVAIALLALVGVFTVLGLAAYIIGPLAPVVLVLAASVALLGAGVLLTGLGITALSVGLVALAGAVYANGAAFSLLIEDIFPLIPMMMKNLGLGLIELIKAVNKAIPELGQTVIELFRALVNIIETSGIIVIVAIIKFVLEILKTIEEYLPKFIEVGTNILIALLEGISDNIGKITDVVIEIFVKFIEALDEEQQIVLDAGAKFIIGFINSLADTIRENKDLFKDAILNLIASILGLTKEDFIEEINKFKTIGGYLVEGLTEGISGVKDKAKGAMKTVAGTIIAVTRKVLEVRSPSEVLRAIGRNIIEGLTLGIEDEGEEPVKASSKIAQKVVDQNAQIGKSSAKTMKSSFDKFVAMIEDRKYFNKLSLQEELEEWETIQLAYAKGTEERKKADREVYRLKNALVKEGYDHSVKWIEKEKFYNRLSLEEELAAWERVHARALEGSTEKIESAREVYRVQKELSEQSSSDAEKIEKNKYEHSVKWIEKEKKLKRLSLKEELDAWERVQKRYVEQINDTEDEAIAREARRVNAEKEALRVREEINQGTLDFYEEIVKVNADANDERARLDKEYYDKEKELNDKRINDIAKVNDAYDQSVKSRTDTLYSSFGLFDEVKIVDPNELKSRRTELQKELTTVTALQAEHKQYLESISETDDTPVRTVKAVDAESVAESERLAKLATAARKADSAKTKELEDRAAIAKAAITKIDSDLITGEDLLNNLSSQVDAFEDWQKDITKLAKKGIDKELVKELQAMGPKTAKQIKALLMLSDQGLSTYVELWQSKHKEAKDRAVTELDYLKTATLTKIKEINTDSDVLLATYTDTWKKNLKNVTKETDATLLELRSKWKSNLSGVREDSESEIIKLVANVQKELKRPSWTSIGTGMLNEILVGIKNGTAALAEGAKTAAKTALNAMNRVLSENKPNIKDIGGFITNALTGEPLRYAPVIKPVLDLTNIRSGQSEMDKIFAAAALNTTPNTFGFSSGPASYGTTNTSNINIAQLIVREEADVTKIARELQNMQTTGSR